MPPTNDNLANARVVSTTGWSTFADTNVDATTEAGETAAGYYETVFYRIEPDGDGGDLTIQMDSLSYNYSADLYIYPGGGTPANFADLINGFANFIDSIGGPGADAMVIPAVSASDVYYLVVYGSFNGDEGTFDVEIFVPAVYVLNADDYANLSSPTVSIVDTDWVRDEQYREYDFTNFDTSKGQLDYTRSVIIADAPLPPDRYRIELYRRFGNIGGANANTIIVQTRVNDMPLNPVYGSGLDDDTDGDEAWVPVTDETGVDFGGPLFLPVTGSETYSLDWGQTSEDESSAGVPQRYMEVQQIRFISVTNDALPASRWLLMKSGAEPWAWWGYGQTRVRAHPNGTTFYASGNYYNNISGTSRLSIWEYDVNGDEITLVSPTGLGDVDLMEVPGNSLWWHDFTVMPNGDIYLIVYEQGTTTQHRLWLKYWDGASWTTITTDVAGVGVGNNWWRFSCSIDNDGTDVYMAWGQHVNGGASYYADDWHWRCKKYDVGGASFSELGTGQTAYGGAVTYDGNAEFPVKLKCSPNGVVWVGWNAADENAADGANPEWNDNPHLWYWNGSAWQDSAVPTPSTAPSGIAGHSYTTTPNAPGGRNYCRIISDPVHAVDFTFCHHDGPSEYPSFCYQWVWADQTAFYDYAEFVYYEYDGASWDNEIRMPSQTQWPALSHFNNDAGLDGKHWHAGFSLRDDGSVPYLFGLMGELGATRDNVVAARCLPDGSAFESLGGTDTATKNFVDTPSNPSPLNTGGNWLGNGEAGLILGNRAVGIWQGWNGWIGEGAWCSIWKPGGGLLSMNWRSSDRSGNAQRVLVGG